VLTVAETNEEEIRGEMVDGLRTWRLKWPRQYTQHSHRQQCTLKKLFWHLQDHYDPRNVTIVESVAKEFSPDIVNVHIAQGIGHNIASGLLRARPYKVCYILHDLALACVRTSMYRNGRNCEKQCVECRLSSASKMRFFHGDPRICFISPSKSNLDTLDSILNLEAHQCAVIPNLDLDEPVHRRWSADRKADDPLNLIYVGRLDPTKGIEFLLDILDGIDQQGLRFRMTVLGGGPLLEPLRRKFSSSNWLTLKGHVEPSEVKYFMSESDLLLFPSIWREVLGNVIRQALRAGVPAIVSDMGGPKELITDNVTGLILRAGDARAWTTAITNLINNREVLSKLQANAEVAGSLYSVDELGARYLQFVNNGRRKDRES
jgi:glycosyltransferase involved in cell wall biosynthesis